MSVCARSVCYQEHMSTLAHGGNNSALMIQETPELLLLCVFQQQFELQLHSLLVSSIIGLKEREREEQM